MKFLDEAKIYIRSGHGGGGALSFRREKYVEYGGPDGGNGGKGGDIIVECVDGLNTLIDYRYKQHFKAKRGDHGQGRSRTGKAADDLILPVPPGTQILAEDKETILADLTEVGDRITLLKGGDGGLGNEHFKSSTNRAPRRTTPGGEEQEQWIWLKLKLIADAGLVGLPNAGKSTFLAATSHARPKIADYPFTTLKPQLGVVAHKGGEFVLADIPGLIEGASDGIGLGHKFLGHVERCRVLLHLVDGTQDDVTGAYQTIRDELEAYEVGALKDKEEVLALNKIDALDEETLAEKLQELEQISGKKPFAISGVSGQNVSDATEALAHIIGADKEAERIEEEAASEDDTSWAPL